MKIILDTNVFISGIFWSGPPYQIIKAWHAHKLKLIVSQEILVEYDRVTKNILKKCPEVDLSPFVELLTIHAEIHVPRTLVSPVSRDTDDDKFIACALGAGIRTIVSGDQDLLVLSGFEKIEIITPAVFVRRHLK